MHETFYADIVDVPSLYMISIKCFLKRVRGRVGNEKQLRHKNKSTEAILSGVIFDACNDEGVERDF